MKKKIREKRKDLSGKEAIINKEKDCADKKSPKEENMKPKSGGKYFGFLSTQIWWISQYCANDIRNNHGERFHSLTSFLIFEKYVLI